MLGLLEVAEVRLALLDARRLLVGTLEIDRLEFAREELRPSVAEAPVGVGVCNDGDHDIVLFDTAGLQFLDEIDIEVCLLLLGSLSARDANEDNLPGAIDIESGILDDEV